MFHFINRHFVIKNSTGDLHTVAVFFSLFAIFPMINIALPVVNRAPVRREPNTAPCSNAPDKEKTEVTKQGKLGKRTKQ